MVYSTILKKKDYDIYFSVELTHDNVLKNELDPSKRLILWIQDPRPMYEWDEIFTVKLILKHLTIIKKSMISFILGTNKDEYDLLLKLNALIKKLLIYII